MFERSTAEDKELVHVNADHYGFSRTEPRDATIHEAGSTMTRWLRQRFPARA